MSPSSRSCTTRRLLAAVGALLSLTASGLGAAASGLQQASPSDEHHRATRSEGAGSDRRSISTPDRAGEHTAPARAEPPASYRLPQVLARSEAAHQDPNGQPEADSGRTPKAVVRARDFLAVTAHPLASDAAYDMLAQGGSAIDAAIAAQAVLALVEPQSSGLGGGAFLLHHDPASGRVQAYDGRETAPASARADRFLDEDGRPLGFERAVIGGRSVGVPGVIRMLELVHRDHGRLPWASLFAPAIRHAREGFAISPRLHALLARERWLRADTEAAAIFFQADGRPWPVGHRLRNPALAETLEAIALRGADALYNGPIASDMVTRVRTHAGNPGDLSDADLRDYRAVRRTPLCTPYRSWLICGMPPPSSGAITVAQTLAIEDLVRDAQQIAEPARQGASATGSAEVARIHRFSEASRLAFADRDRWIGDPDFVRVPVGALLDPRYLKARAALVGPSSLGRAPPGDPERFLAQTTPESAIETELESTTHLSIVDRNGRTVAMTSSIEHAFGSRLMVRGFLLNNQLTDFSFLPKGDHGPIANRVEGGKRPRSSMAPTLVFTSTAREHADPTALDDRSVDIGRRRLALAIGSPGGALILPYVARTLVGVLADGLPLQQVIDAPNVGSRNGPTELEADTTAQALAEQLASRGHRIAITPMTSGLHGIARVCARDGDQCILESGTDPRREGIARGQ